MQRGPRIPSLSDCCCRLMTIKKLHCSAAGCLKSIHLTIQTAISIQASPQQFQLGCTNQLEKKQLFLITHANSITQHTQEKSDTSWWCQMCWMGTYQHVCSWLNTSGARFPLFTLSKVCSLEIWQPQQGRSGCLTAEIMTQKAEDNLCYKQTRIKQNLKQVRQKRLMCKCSASLLFYCDSQCFTSQVICSVPWGLWKCMHFSIFITIFLCKLNNCTSRSLHKGFLTKDRTFQDRYLVVKLLRAQFL